MTDGRLGLGRHRGLLTSPTDHYIQVTKDELRATLTEYEQHLLAQDGPAGTPNLPQPAGAA